MAGMIGSYGTPNQGQLGGGFPQRSVLRSAIDMTRRPQHAPIAVEGPGMISGGAVIHGIPDNQPRGGLTNGMPMSAIGGMPGHGGVSSGGFNPHQMGGMHGGFGGHGGDQLGGQLGSMMANDAFGHLLGGYKPPPPPSWGGGGSAGQFGGVMPGGQAVAPPVRPPAGIGGGMPGAKAAARRGMAY